MILIKLVSKSGLIFCPRNYWETYLSSYGATIGSDDCDGLAPNATEKYEGFPFLVDLLMQTKEQLHTAEGEDCTGVILSDHWIATSEGCCENIAGGVIDFSDDKTNSQGNKAMGQSGSVSFPCTGGNCFAGRKRRGATVFDFKKSSRSRRSTYEELCGDDDSHTGSNCHECGFCIKNGICLLRSHVNILRKAEIHGIPAKKICLPKQKPIHGKQCWITGFDEVNTRKPIEMNMFNKGDSNGNEWCIDHSDYTRETTTTRRRRDSLDGDNNALTIPDNLVCAGYPDEDESDGHSGDTHDETLAANTGFEPARGGPIICKEPVNATEPNGDSILVFVGVSHSNMLSQEAGKPGLFSRIYDEKTWIENKLKTWSDWSTCDHTCKAKRTRGCGFIDSKEPNCEGGLVTETYDCVATNYTSNKRPGDEKILQADGTFGCYPETENILPKSQIDNNTIKMCDVKMPRFRREIEALAAEGREKRSTVKKQSRIINGADIEPYSWPWLVRLNFLTQIQFNNIEGASKAGFKKDAFYITYGTILKDSFKTIVWAQKLRRQDRPSFSELYQRALINLKSCKRLLLLMMTKMKQLGTNVLEQSFTKTLS